MTRIAMAASQALRSSLGGALALACATLATPAHAEVRFHGEAGGSYAVQVMSWRDIPFRSVVRQQYDYSCGSAALATLLHYQYGVPIGETEVFRAMYAVGDQARIRQVGFSMLDMKHYLESRGFQADGLRLSLDRLASLNLPAIALVTHGTYRHFVVIKGVRDGRVLVGDPALGLQTYARADFEAIWNGVALAIRRAPDGTAPPVFNRDDDWRPWAVAPVGDAQEPTSPTDLLREMPELYQIAPVHAVQ